MRNAASMLGMIGGIMAIFLGFFSFGYTEMVEQVGEVEGLMSQVDRVGLVRWVSFAAPILAIVGGAMAKTRALWAGGLLLIASGMIAYTFSFNVFTMFPIGFTAVSGILAIAAGRPDEEKAHF